MDIRLERSLIVIEPQKWSINYKEEEAMTL